MGRLRDRRVLVVDDDRDARDLVEVVLLGAGALVEKAASGQEGMAALQRFRPHILISDIGMAQEDGYSFLRRVRALGPQSGGSTPALALTAYARPRSCRAIAVGFAAHIAKPSKVATVVAGGPGKMRKRALRRPKLSRLSRCGGIDARRHCPFESIRGFSRLDHRPGEVSAGALRIRAAPTAPAAASAA